MRAFRVPEVALLVCSEDDARCRDKVRLVTQLICVPLNQSPRHDVDLELTRKCAIVVQVDLEARVLGMCEEILVLRHPAAQMVFGQDGEMAALTGSAANVLDSAGVVEVKQKRLVSR